MATWSSFLTELPKCEHHMHLEGSLSPSLLFRLAEKNQVALPVDDPAFASPAALEARYHHFTSLDDFLHYYFVGMSALITADDFESLAYEYFVHAHQDGVRHAEVFFDPQAHTSRGIAYETVVAGFSSAQQRAAADLGLTSKLVLCFLRNLPVADAQAAYTQAQALGHFSDGRVAAVGLDSSEVGFPPELFRDIYAAAAGAGVRRTAHAGEEGDASYIARALDLCGVERIDHGIHLADDAQLMARVAAQQTMLTVCPLSNVRLRCVSTMADLPLRRFLDAGVRFSLNSDDPAYFGGYILDNYLAVQDAFSFSLPEWRTIALQSIEGSWCDDDRKAAIAIEVEACVEKYKSLA